MKNHEKSMFVKSIRDASGDVWESLGILWSDPECSRMISGDFRKSYFFHDFLVIFRCMIGGECFAPPPSPRGSAPSVGAQRVPPAVTRLTVDRWPQVMRPGQNRRPWYQNYLWHGGASIATCSRSRFQNLMKLRGNTLDIPRKIS